MIRIVIIHSIMKNQLRIVDGKVCRFGVTSVGHERRYCYAQVEHTKKTFAMWDGQKHPPESWIRFKSATQEILKPEWTAS